MSSLILLTLLFRALLLSTPALAAPGDIVCRYTAITPEKVNYYTCTELAQRYDIAVDDFFTLNPVVDRDCQTLKPNTEYCVKGFLDQAASTDGFCGPQHGNSSCLGTDRQCCNGETWKCGDTFEDCQPGTCHSGNCAGFPSDYSMDGACGRQNNNLQCGGKWGDCCNLAGRCGTGEPFCGVGKCQLGNCTIIIPTPRPPRKLPLETSLAQPTSQPSGPPTPKPTGISADGSCGGPQGLKCNGSRFGGCCSSSRYCGNTLAHCAQGCQKDFSSDCLIANVPSLNGECGPSKGSYTCAGGPFDGHCCSRSGFCGKSDAYCGDGCQQGFGRCA